MKQFHLFIVVFCVNQVVAARDPFWPIGYTPTSSAPVQATVPDPQPDRTSRELTDEELADLARQETMKIKEILDRKATAVFGGKVHALVNGDWVSVGDSITVKTLGNTYRLKILTLTVDNIELEPHRSPIGTSRTP